VKSAPLPELPGFTDDRIKLLAAICRELQILTKEHPFFIPTRKIGEILDVHWTLAARWLRALETLGIIRLAPDEVRRRGGNHCPRYHCDLSRSTQGLTTTKPLAICDGSLVIPEKAA
jgi:hypothetical protein